MPTKETTTTDPAADLAAAEDQLRALLAEQAGLPGRLADAAAEADAVGVLRCRRRGAELTDEVAAVRLRVARLRVAALEAEEAAAAARIEPLAAAAEVAQAAARQASEVAKGASDHLWDGREQWRTVKINLAQARHDLDDLITAARRGAQHTAMGA